MGEREVVSEVRIRPYSPEDYSSVKAIYEEGGLFDKVTDKEKGLRTKSERDSESLLVAIKDQQIVGTVSIIEDGRIALLFRLVVKESERRQGIGRELMSEAERILKERGYEEVNIVVNDKDTTLQSYYEKQNYKKGRSWRWM